jgi:hypothetical protein
MEPVDQKKIARARKLLKGSNKKIIWSIVVAFLAVFGAIQNLNLLSKHSNASEADGISGWQSVVEAALVLMVLSSALALSYFSDKRFLRNLSPDLLSIAQSQQREKQETNKRANSDSSKSSRFKALEERLKAESKSKASTTQENLGRIYNLTTEELSRYVIQAAGTLNWRPLNGDVSSGYFNFSNPELVSDMRMTVSVIPHNSGAKTGSTVDVSFSVPMYPSQTRKMKDKFLNALWQLAGSAKSTQRTLSPANDSAVGAKKSQKTCPDCAETILKAANKCKHCGFRFDNSKLT